MKTIAKVNQDLGIAFLSEEESGMRVGTIPQRWGEKESARKGYLSARFSRSKEGIEDIYSSVQSKNTDASKRLDTIVGSYGHASVSALSGVTVYLEDIPLWLAARIHYVLEPGYMSQESSTRYIDFSAPNYNPALTNPALIDYALQAYNKLLEPTKSYLQRKFNINAEDKRQKTALEARTFDCLRYLLPGTLNTSMSLRTDARVLSGLISLLKDGRGVERTLGIMLEELMLGNKELANLGYVPEVDALIRHTEKTTGRYDSDEAILGEFQKLLTFQLAEELRDTSCVAYETRHDVDLIKNYLALLYPNQRFDFVHHHLIANRMGEILYRYHNRHRMIGNKAQMGAIMVDGKMDFGSWRDMNRHRSLKKVVPHLETFGDQTVHPDFSICPYLEPNSNIYNKYVDALYGIYALITRELPNHLKRINAPMAHNVRYRVSGSMDEFAYTTELRSRGGGHIAYRLIANDWFKAIAKVSWAFHGVKQHIIPANPNSRTEFLDRS